MFSYNEFGVRNAWFGGECLHVLQSRANVYLPLELIQCLQITRKTVFDDLLVI